MVVEHALDARLGALSGAVSRGRAGGWACEGVPALGEQRVAAAATVATSLARWEALDQSVKVDVAGRSGGSCGSHCSPSCAHGTVPGQRQAAAASGL